MPRRFWTLFWIFMVLAAPQAALADGCGLAPRPAVEVTLAEKPVGFDTTQPIDSLNKLAGNEPAPYRMHYHADVAGVMSGNISVDHRISFSRDIDPATEQGCVAIKKVHIEISIDPTIYIASDLQNRTCWFKEIFAHESHHVDVDRELIRKYQGQFTDGLNMVLMTPADYVSANVPAADLDFTQAQMQEGIEQALSVLFTKMMSERQERQHHVDTLDEYSRIARICRAST